MNVNLYIRTLDPRDTKWISQFNTTPSQFRSMICSDFLRNTSEITLLFSFSFIENFSLRIGVTARGHFASNSAYPRQASSSVSNRLPNWLDFMVRRVDVYSRYFSRLEEAGTSAISIIDIPGWKLAPFLETPSPRDRTLFFLLDSMPPSPILPPSNHALFPDFLRLFPERRVIIPG